MRFIAPMTTFNIIKNIMLDIPMPYNRQDQLVILGTQPLVSNMNNVQYFQMSDIHDFI